jgi:hypothetical protein
MQRCGDSVKMIAVVLNLEADIPIHQRRWTPEEHTSIGLRMPHAPIVSHDPKVSHSGSSVGIHNTQVERYSD